MCEILVVMQKTCVKQKYFNSNTKPVMKDHQNVRRKLPVQTTILNRNKVLQRCHCGDLISEHGQSEEKISPYNRVRTKNKSANALALCHPPSASFCSVLANRYGAPAFSHKIYNIPSDILIEFEVNLGIIIEKYA